MEWWKLRGGQGEGKELNVSYLDDSRIVGI